MKRFIFPLLVCLSIFAACGEKNITKAKIFERKEVDNNKLMIKYTFIVAGKAFTDSSIIENQVLKSDSITLEFDKENPSNNSLTFTK